MVLLKSLFSEITEYSIKNRNLQWRSEGPAGPATAGGGLKGPARSPPGQEEVVAVNPWPEAQTSCLRGGAKIIATPLETCLIYPCDTYIFLLISRQSA